MQIHAREIIILPSRAWICIHYSPLHYSPCSHRRFPKPSRCTTTAEGYTEIILSSHYFVLNFDVGREDKIMKGQNNRIRLLATWND